MSQPAENFDDCSPEDCLDAVAAATRGTRSSPYRRHAIAPLLRCPQLSEAVEQFVKPRDTYGPLRAAGERRLLVERAEERS